MQARKASYGLLNQQKKQFKASALEDIKSEVRDYAKEERDGVIKLRNEKES